MYCEAFHGAALEQRMLPHLQKSHLTIFMLTHSLTLSLARACENCRPSRLMQGTHSRGWSTEDNNALLSTLKVLNPKLVLRYHEY